MQPLAGLEELTVLVGLKPAETCLVCLCLFSLGVKGVCHQA